MTRIELNPHYKEVRCPKRNAICVCFDGPEAYDPEYADHSHYYACVAHPEVYISDTETTQ
jgi:hypothetical protein